MKRSCNLELCLLPPSYDSQTGDLMEKSGGSGTPQKEEYHKMTIFYNERMYVSDVTDPQAREILLLANRETEERSSRTPNGSDLSNPLSPNSLNRFHHPSRSLHGSKAEASMKRSLQRFLQKRKDRIQATSPYHS